MYLIANHPRHSSGFRKVGRAVPEPACRCASALISNLPMAHHDMVANNVSTIMIPPSFFMKFDREQQHGLMHVRFHLQYTPVACKMPMSLQGTMYRCWKHAEPALLIGETGTGKTTVCQLVAHMRGQPLVIVNCNQHTEASDFLGSYRPTRQTTPFD